MSSIERLTAALEARVAAPAERPAIIIVDVPNGTASEVWFTPGAPVGSGRGVKVKLTGPIEDYLAQWRGEFSNPMTIILDDMASQPEDTPDTTQIEESA